MLKKLRTASLKSEFTGSHKESVSNIILQRNTNVTLIRL